MAPCSGFVRMYVCIHVSTGLDDGMYVFMYVCMCSIGWDGTVETWGLGCFYALFCKKRILDDVMMTCYEKSEVGLIRWSGCFLFTHLDSMLSQAFGGWGECI